MSNDGGPAFPVPSETEGTWAEKECKTWLPYTGMTLRDWFAGLAMQGMYAEDAENYTFKSAAEAAYRTADAMLKARETVEDVANNEP